MRHFCGWKGASPVNRDPGLAALKIQLPGSMRACLFGVGRKRPGAGAVPAVQAHCAFSALWTLGKSSCVAGLTLITTETDLDQVSVSILSWGPEGLWEVPGRSGQSSGSPFPRLKKRLSFLWFDFLWKKNSTSKNKIEK